MRIVIPGGSGQVGQLLARHFHSAGHHVTVLSRSVVPASWQIVYWDGKTQGPWAEALESSDLCINLAGRSVNCRYTSANRQEIYRSRIDSTMVLGQVIASLPHPPRLWLNASIATIYRHALDRPMDEATGELGGSEPGAPNTWNFSIKVAKDWEAAFFADPLPRTRRIALRSAITFSPDRGGVFEVLSRLVRFGLGGQNGTGHQFVSWLHDADLIRGVDWLIQREDFSGAVNLASPNPLPNHQFMRILRRAWKIPIGLPAATWMIEVGSFLLRTESELLLKSRRVIPSRMMNAGFEFKFQHWQEAAEDLVNRWNALTR